MSDTLKGWTGKRLVADLTVHRAWTEEIPAEELKTGVGGRGLNSTYFLNRPDSPLDPAAPENPIAFSVGPIAGTYAPCAGWTSIAAVSPLPFPSRFVHASLPGHWGPQLKRSGFDQLIVRGRAEKPLCLVIGEEGARFKDATHLRGKDTVETTVAIEEEEGNRNTEVLCIGPAGENRVLFANATNRFSWTADHIGLGCLFGSKNLKAIVVRGDEPVRLYDSDRFLQTCTTLRQRIQRDPNATRLREEGTFLLFKQKNGYFGIRNYSEASTPDFEARWVSAYFSDYFYGREACFSCPVHCGRTTDVNGNYFGGVHAESAWSLGPRIGLEDWGKTLLLHRVCQRLGLDPSATGSLLSWVMDCYEKGILSARELDSIPCHWADEKAALQRVDSIVDRKGIGEVLALGALGAAKFLGKGLEEVPHVRGTDLPIRDPRSSVEYSLSRCLFPQEWDYLQSLASPLSSEEPSSQGTENGALENTLAAQKRKVLADLVSLCPLVMARFPLLTFRDVGELVSAATGLDWDEQALMASVQGTIETEKILSQRFKSESAEHDVLPSRFFKDLAERDRLEEEVARYERSKRADSI